MFDSILLLFLFGISACIGYFFTVGCLIIIRLFLLILDGFLDVWWQKSDKYSINTDNNENNERKEK